MRVAFIVLAVVLVVIALLFPLFVLFVHPEWLPNLRDTSIIYVSLFMCVGAILFIVMTGLIALIAFMIRDHIVPALEKADDTLQTVKRHHHLRQRERGGTYHQSGRCGGRRSGDDPDPDATQPS